MPSKHNKLLFVDSLPFHPLPITTSRKCSNVILVPFSSRLHRDGIRDIIIQECIHKQFRSTVGSSKTIKWRRGMRQRLNKRKQFYFWSYPENIGRCGKTPREFGWQLQFAPVCTRAGARAALVRSATAHLHQSYAIGLAGAATRCTRVITSSQPGNPVREHP